MTNRDKKTVMRIIRHIELIFVYIEPIKSLNEFEINFLVQDAVVFNLIQIGELANNHLTDSFRSTNNSLPWSPMYGLRNRIVHDYVNIQTETIYEVIKEDLPPLLNTLHKIFDS